MGKKKKNYYYRYLRKKIRNLKVSEILRICGQLYAGERGCDDCPLQQYGICLSGADDSALEKKINFRFVYFLKKYHFDDGVH